MNSEKTRNVDQSALKCFALVAQKLSSQSRVASAKSVPSSYVQTTSWNMVAQDNNTTCGQNYADFLVDEAGLEKCAE